MACHHHHNQHHHSSATCCSTCYCSQCFHPPPPSPPYTLQSEPLLQALASLLQPQHNHHLNQIHVLKPFQDATKNHHFHRKQHPQQDPNSLISSLLSRIDVLESSLHSFSRASNCSSNPSFMLKDAAARVIQTHFRAFLVHRSRTLRQLKDLAFIKSSLNSLKLSVSNKTHLHPQVVSQKAMDLLLKLDSFQGGDPMIRDGKRSVSRDLIQFLEYIDGLALKRNKLLYKNAKNMRILRSSCGEVMEKLRKLERFSSNEEGDDVVELEGFHQGINGGEYQNKNAGVLVKRQGIRPKVNKTVRFAENGNVYRIISNENDVSSSGDGSLTDECVSSDDHGDIMENLVDESEDLVANLEVMNLNDGESLQSSDREKNSRRNLSKQAKTETGGNYQIQGGDFVFSAPLPLKMESKADPVKKKDGALKIVS
ncbi:FAR1-related sequence 5 [Hibiscus syriacus]|uniref:FAR1-related sequence 5 n=1 Tax=Hibiscus syriacus TaxID=106335 RepID=A0A6A2XM68_HIBSY|nr:BAG family molecular chaperone regulator 8, chloroplastic-like [Hibiscus syriacus]KAE8659489.1 FAR1-related sequence 5 [Hibiscus syriacus]